MGDGRAPSQLSPPNNMVERPARSGRPLTMALGRRGAPNSWDPQR
jgi:hypothetical protein